MRPAFSAANGGAFGVGACLPWRTGLELGALLGLLGQVVVAGWRRSARTVDHSARGQLGGLDPRRQVIDATQDGS